MLNGNAAGECHHKWGKPSSIRLWTVALVVYAVATLIWLDRRAAATASVQPAPRREAAIGGDANPDALARYRMITAHPGAGPFTEVVFDIPFRVETLEQSGQSRFMLFSLPGADRCAVQVIAECDNRFSFAHVFDNITLAQDVFAFQAPLTGEVAVAFWRPIDHAGQWSDWERSGLRRLQIKVFARKPLATQARLCYQFDAATSAGGARLDWSHVLTSPVPLGDRFEMAFDLKNWHGNPYDYAVLSTVLEVTPAGAGSLRLRPFLHQNFEAVATAAGETIRPCGPKHFLARYRPRVTGRHAYRLLAPASDGGERVLESGSFEVIAGTPPDFLRVSSRSPRFFEHADGRFFYPIGWNIPYPVDRPYGQEYVSYLPDRMSLGFMGELLDDLADSGGTFARFWLSDWWNGLEWNAAVDAYGGIGRYNLKHAWMNDRIVEQCERRGIRLQWEAGNHTRLKEDFGWPEHPYNIRNGGFLPRPNDFWTHPRARRLSQNRLLYLLARYADSPAIHSFTIMSEPDIVSGIPAWPQAKSFILSQLRFLRREDPYGHIAANQLCLPNRDPSFFRAREVEFVSANVYSGGIAGFSDNQIAAIQDFAELYGGVDRPTLISECAGYYAGDSAYKMRRDTLGSLWSGVACGLAGTPLSWWWNFNYGEDLGGWYRVVADFMRDEDLIVADAPEGGGWRTREVSGTSRTGNLRALMAGNAKRRFLFVYNYDTLDRTRGEPSACDENRVAFVGLTPGAYGAEYWDLQHGRTAITETFTVGEAGAGELAPPPFTEGWAVKIRPLAEARPQLAPPAEKRRDTAGPAPAGRAADWSWRILPQGGIVFPGAAARTVMDVRIGLPEVCRPHGPRVTDADGRPVPFAWEPLDGGAGWRIMVRGAATQPLTVTVDTGAASSGQTPLAPASWGLSVTVAQAGSPPLRTVELFQKRFDALSIKRQTRLNVIDQVENPLGENTHFLAVYQGPLLAPEDGEYVFAANSDDGSFVKIDGKTVIAWPGGHDMEVPGRPAANLWEHRGVVTLKRGMHQVEFYHQQSEGASLARLGWRPPHAKTPPDAPLIAEPGSTPGAPAITVVPDWALDGRIPCTVEVCHRGETLVTLTPALGLELRRPRTRISVVAWARNGRRQHAFFAGEGLRVLTDEGLTVPVWAWNSAQRPFSLAWEVCAAAGDQRVLQTLLYDCEIPLTVQVGEHPPVTQMHAPRHAVTWPLTARDRGASWTVRLGTVPLLRATLGHWAVMPEGVPPPRQTASLTRLLEAGPTCSPVPLAGRRLAPWWRGTPPESVTPGLLRLDPWSAEAVARDPAWDGVKAGTGVLVRLDRRVLLLGLSGQQASLRLHAFMRAVRKAGGEPVLVLNPEVEITAPSAQALALTMNRLSIAFECPFIDLREAAP